jgi:hypothetical protein
LETEIKYCFVGIKRKNLKIETKPQTAKSIVPNRFQFQSHPHTHLFFNALMIGFFLSYKNHVSLSQDIIQNHLQMYAGSVEDKLFPKCTRRERKEKQPNVF